MSEAYNKLIKTLQTIFEMDKADLDFGIYCIMNQKRDDINKFLEQDLLPQVKQAFADYAHSGQGDLQKELEIIIEQAKKLGAPDPENTEAALEIKKKMNSAVDATALENDVFSKLHTFFSRYYDKGDFISQRRYKKDTYAIPYEGEEVKLYWANHDQYYIKSSEHLRDYAFIAKDSEDKNKSFRIKLVEADTEKDNVKAKSGEERRFVLDEENSLSIENSELLIHFNFIPIGKKKQLALNKEAVETIFKQESEEYAEWMSILKTQAPTEKNPNRTLLEKHLNDYTARNTFDYFIHKDLGGFLNRELDFFIKNEVLYLDDIDDAAFEVTEQQFRKIKILRSIAKKIIRMLAQLEDFQKKMWLKKKFVVDTNYCMTLDRVDDIFYREIAENQEQIKEWIDLEFTTESNGVTDDFLKKNPFLILDTKFFNENFKDRILASITNIHEQCDGLLLNTDNFHGLRLIKETYKETAKCVYLDPPYNTGKDGFLYKDTFCHSSWASFIQNRIDICREFLSEDGALFSSIDESEQVRLEFILDQLFGSDNHPVTHYIQVRYPNKTLSEDNDYHKTIEQVLCYSKNNLIFKPIKDLTEYNVNKFEWEIEEKTPCESLELGGKKVEIFKPEHYKIKKVASHLKALKETWATGSLLRQKGSSGEYFGINLAPRKDIDGIGCLYKVYGIGEDGLGYRYFTGPKKESATRGKFYSGIPLDTLKKLNSGDSSKEKPIYNFHDFASDFGNCRHEGKVDIRGGKKPEKLISKIINWVSSDDANDLILDPFSGSGTSSAVAMKLGKKFIGVEYGEYFDSKVLIRLKHCLNGDQSGIKNTKHGGLFRYQKLESYEDTLNNLQLSISKQQQPQLAQHDQLREDYMLGYWLDVETADSPSLLNIDQFEDPFNYKLNIGSSSVGATKPTTVDLVETFNYLIGLTVKTIDVIRGFKIVTGTNPKDESVLVVWRNLKEKDNAQLEEFLDKQGYNPRDTEFEHIYVNGDHTLEDPQSKVKMTEIEFKRLMFDVKDV